jgi:4-hydroxy-4-methyl-2-oxoglutarate aldolase
MSDDNARLSELGTATVSDALDRLLLPGSAHGIGAIRDGLKVAGPAYTVRYVPAGYPKGTVGDYIDDVPPGSVVVLDNQGRTDATVWGDILTEFSSSRQIAGTAIWGVCRDVQTALRIGYPLFTRGRFMRTGKDRMEVADVDIAVALGDAQVRPADLVVGDDDGVVVIPQQRLAEVRDVAEEIGRVEDAIAAAIRQGSSIREARREFGYHQLQRHSEH